MKHKDEVILNVVRNNQGLTTKALAKRVPEYRSGVVRRTLRRLARRGLVFMDDAGGWYVKTNGTAG